MRYWLLTNTTYGPWLPGDSRGSVTSVRDRRPGDTITPSRVEHSRMGDAHEKPMPGLYSAAFQQMNGEPILLSLSQAETVLAQFQETAEHRQWVLRAVAIMANHFHVVVEVPGDPDPQKVLVDFKAYASRALNQKFGPPEGARWWTRNGSKRKLRNEQYLENAVNYVLYKQEYPLVVWGRGLGRLV